MDARPVLFRIARLLAEHGLEAVLIGNAAAARQGAPITTVDFDFMFDKTPANLRKLKSLAAVLDAVILRPYCPASDLFRIVRDEDGLQDRSPVSAAARVELLVADLADVIKSKRAAGRPRDIASLEIIEKALHEETRNQKSEAGSSEERK
jgi:hypothetical protein